MHLQTPMFDISSDWKVPRDLPNLKAADMIGLDTEAYNPNIKEKGIAVRRDGYCVGISVAVPEGQAWYLPFAHAEGDQLEKDKVIKWAKDNLCNPNQPKVGANLLFDLDYLYHMGVEVSGPFYDILNAERIIDENQFKYNLDRLANKYTGRTKNETLLEDKCNAWGLKGKPQEHLWRFAAKYTGPYAEEDALLPIQIYQKQLKEIQRQGLDQVWEMETDLLPMLLYMKRIGVKIDTDRLTEVLDMMQNELDEQRHRLYSLAGGKEINIWAADSIAHLYDAQGLWYPMTAKTNKPSFRKGWLEDQPDDISKALVACREKDKFIGTFIVNGLFGMMTNGRIHTQLNQLKPVTGRFSCNLPNLQNIPARTKLGKMLREAFIPDEGYGWCKADYAQIEIRILAHYAMGHGADEIRAEFNSPDSVDYHTWTAAKAGIERGDAKNLNFKIIYGGGPASVAGDLGVTVPEAKKFLSMYLDKLPFIKKTVNLADSVAQSRGYVKTLFGRRRRFDLWEPADYELSHMYDFKANKSKKRMQAMVDAYVSENPNSIRWDKPYKKGVKRAGTYKAFNAVDQGTAADIMKASMVAVWKSGVCNVIKPYLTVHDELDFGYPLNKEGIEAVEEVRRIMATTTPLKVPTPVDPEVGANWAKANGETFNQQWKEFRNAA